MKIKYKKKRLNQNLFFGIIWTVLGLLNLKYSGENNWLDYGYIFVAILYWCLYFYEKTYQYLIIDNGWIKENSPFGKRINLSEINWIKRSADGYILKTHKDELTIDTQVIDENSMTELNRILEKLNLSADKAPPFANK